MTTPVHLKKIVVTNDMLSDYSLETKKRHAVSSGKVSKIIYHLDE